MSVSSPYRNFPLFPTKPQQVKHDKPFRRLVNLQALRQIDPDMPENMSSPPDRNRAEPMSDAGFRF